MTTQGRSLGRTLQDPKRKCLLKLSFSSFLFDRKRQKYYHSPLMSAPAVIDSLEFARAAQSMSGSLPVASLQRLHDVLFDTDGSLSYEVRGGCDSRQRPQLELRITGDLDLQCQRCLGLLPYVVDVRNTVLLIPPAEQTSEDIDDAQTADAIEASPELEVTSLIEEEVLLSLPLAPRHAEGECASRLEQTARAAESAFAKLGALKRPRNQH
jgi:uncharacterized protein